MNTRPVVDELDTLQRRLESVGSRGQAATKAAIDEITKIMTDLGIKVTAKVPTDA